MKYKVFENISAIITLILVIIAIILGKKNFSSDIESILRSKHGIDELKKIDTYLYHATNGNENYYVCIGESEGYGGILELAVIIDTSLIINKIHILNHKETNSYFKKVEKKDFLNFYNRKSVYDLLNNGSADAISGATYTSNAISKAISNGVKIIGVKILNLQILNHQKNNIKITFHDVLLLIFLSIMLISGFIKTKIVKYIRWSSLISGIIFIGFIYNKPITLSKFTSFVSGYFPLFVENIYWYVLFLGVFSILLITNKNPYCYWFCPFGGTQDCLAFIGKAKVFVPSKKVRYFLLWGQRFTALFFLLTALYYQNSSLASYEVFGALFKFTGSDILFILLAITIILSLFIKRPWCNYLCPINAIFDYVKFIRKAIAGIAKHALKRFKN